MKSLVSFIALIWLALADPTMTTKNGYLDPGRITWWQEKWAPNPIELTQTNAGTSGVSVNINFRTFTSVNSASNSGIVQLIVPSTFSSTTTYTSAAMTITGGVDMTASFPLGTSLPSAGIYGPFQVITRSSSTGQIYDANYVFGCVAVSASVTISSSSLTTGAATLISTTGIVGSKDALTFTFTVPSGVNLWKHDIFEIIPDSRWTITSPTCQSVDITSVTNYIKGPNNDNNLPCALAATGGANGGANTATSTATPATNSIYVYGFSQEVINNSGYQVKLQVSSFTFPGSCVTSSSYSWTVKLWRWGTNNLLAGWTGSGPFTPAAGSVTISSWAPYNSAISQTDLPASSSLSIFTKLTFKLSHTVSTGGKVDITFTNASPSTAVWWQDIGDTTNTPVKAKCFLNSYMSGVSCSVSGSAATISVTGSTATLDPSKDISITLLSALTTGAKVSSITSSDGSNTIDTFTAGQSWTFSSTSSSSYAALTQFSYVASDASTYYLDTAWGTGLQVGADTSVYLAWMIQPSTAWSNGYVFKVYLPVTTSGVSLSQTFISSNAAYVDGVQPDNTNDLALSTAASSTAPSVSAGSPATLSIPITASIAAASYFGFGFGDGTNARTALPYVKSNVGTFYECWAKAYASSSASSPVEFSSTVFSVYSSLADSSLTAKPLCKDSLDGIPILVNYHANLLDFNFGDSTNKYMLDVAITVTGGTSTNLGSGLADGSALPIATTSSALTPTATITSNTVTISGSGTVSSTNSAVIFVPNGSTSSTAVAASLTFYYVLASGDPSIKYQLYTGSSSTTLSSTATSITSNAWTAPTSGFYTVGGTSVTTSGTATLGTNTLSIAVGDYLGVGLPKSFTASSPSVSIGGISSSVYTVTSSSNTFAGGFIVGTASTATGSAIATTAGALSYSFGGINAGLSSLSSSATFTTPNLLVFVASGSGAACKAAGDLAVKISAATITSDQCSTNKAFTNGADSVDSTLTLTFNTVNDIPGNGKITITLASSSWTVSNTAVAASCEGSGFTDYDAKNSITYGCSVSGTTVQLTGFAKVTAGTITVNVYHIIPTTTSSTAVSVSCFTDVSTFDAAGNYIDTASSLTNSVSLAVTSVAGNTNSGLVAKAYPNVPGATADIYLSFSLTKAIPAGSIININAGFVSSLSLSSTNTQNYCWTDQYLTSCSVSGTTVSLTIGNALSVGQTVQVYLDAALTIPSTNSTTTGWTISTTWNGVTITQDSTSASPATFPFVSGSTVSNTFTVKSITQVNSISAGESTSYLFSLQTSAAIATTDSIVIQFPRDFDPHVGDTQAFLNDCLPNNLYLTCSSSALGISSGTYCAADHWYVTVTGISKSNTASSTFDITVNNVRNPAAGTTSGKFSFIQYGSDGSVKAISQSTQIITIGAVVANVITLKNVTVDSTELSAATNYNFNFYAANTYTPDFIVSIIFPQEFNHQLRMGSSSACKAVYYDESSTSTSVTTSASFSSATSCTITGNNVTLSFATASSLTVASSGRINLQLTTFYNPQWGHSRSMGWDVSDYSTFMSSKPVEWSNKFDVAVYQFSTGKTYARSYGVLNSGYIGYSLSTIDIAVGDYNPDITSAGIKLLPGQQSSDIVISVLDSNSWPLKSRSLVLSPFSNKNYPDNGTLKYTSAFYNYKAFQMGSQIKFRVAATSTATTGVYYIDWQTPVEKAQDGSTILYSAPLSILVEVCSSLSPIAVSVDNLPSFYQYYTSIPIKVSVTNAPASQLVVTPASSVTGFTFTPTSLTFGPDVTEKYFQVQIGSTYVSSSTSATISYTLTGTDAGAFSAPKSQTATVASSYPQTVAATPGITGTKVSGSEYKISVTTTIAGVLYWGLGCQGSPVLTFSGLSDMVSDLVSPSSSIQTLQEQLADEYAATETDIDSTQDADINAFFNRIHRNHCKGYWASSMVIPTSGATIDLDWLMAGTSYTFTAYIATRLTNDTTAYPIKTYNFTTDAIGSTYTTTVSFTGSVAATSNVTIAQVLAKNMGINPSWLTVSAYSSARLLQSSTTVTSTFTYNVLSDNRYPAYNSQSIIANLNTNSAQAKSDLTSSLALTVSALGASTVVATGTTPSWTAAPAKTDISDTSASFSATSSQAGTIYVSCSDNDLSGRITYAWQVRDGLDATASVVAHNWATVTAATSVNITVSGLSAGTDYICYFTACNNAPQNQLCIDYISSSSTALSSVAITTTGTVDDSAVYMGSLLAFLLILLN